MVIDGKEVYICAGSDTKWLLARVEELAKLVRDDEWVEWDAGTMLPKLYCTECGCWEKQGHAPNCPRQAALKRLEE